MVLLAMVLLVAFEARVVRFLSTTIQVNDGLAYHGAVRWWPTWRPGS